MRRAKDVRWLVSWVGTVGLALAIQSCSRPNDDGIVDSIGQQRELADAITNTLQFIDGAIVAGSIERFDSDGPSLESVQGPTEIRPYVPFTYRLAVAAKDVARVRAASIQWKYAESHLRVPLTVDPTTGFATIQAVDNAEHGAAADQIDGTVFLEDEQGLRGPGVPVMLDFLDPEDLDEPSSLVLASHQGATLAVDLFERDGRLLLSTGGDDAKVTLWDVETGHQHLDLRGHSAAVIGLSATRDGNIMASASRDHTVRVWDTRTGELLSTLGGHQDFVTWVAFSHDDRWLASGSWDGTVLIRNMVDQKLVKTLPVGQRINMLEFSRDGTYLAIASGTMYQKGQVSVWNVADWTLRFAQECEREATALNFAYPAESLTAAVGRGQLHVWDVATGTLNYVLRDGPQDTIPRVGFLPNDPHFIGAITLTGHMFVWNIPAARTERNKVTRLWLTSADFTNDGRWLALADSRGVVWLMPAVGLVSP
jgi:WD40 repeat protein